MTDQVAQLVDVMRRLRTECPWDREQTHASLREYLLEEAYEVVETIDAGDIDALCEELGDLLLQIVFHAQIASESEQWDVQDVAAGIREKLIARHPHVFGDGAAADPDAVNRHWHAAKAQEKGRASVTDGIPVALPALLRAAKVEARSAHLDVPPHAERDWAEQALVRTESEQEFGAQLIALVASAAERGWDAEGALRQAISARMDEIRRVEQA